MAKKKLCLTCKATPCCCNAAFTELSAINVDKTLVASLVPCVDGIRDLYTCLGARAYTVSMVRARWSGGERGVGVEEIVEETPILPTPKVENFLALTQDARPMGTEEVGVVRVSEISARYTEDQLSGTEDDGTPGDPDELFYWEIVIPQPNGMPIRRRFTVEAAPELEPLRFQWTVLLARTYEDRSRRGFPRG